eukprot:CAMPEP_0170557272 /NCGR_PEP_ID=MMETSP0211-20121228/22639_1 /TAXON_ID=311385 /ORGANISM="Pseudokeronopsis sp., Strain OXSARD2" /LENGTH=73 /DNA_ID=CAMNT_0010868139 /DNA_START=75 /DNA_END=293 /DNA_ORIENTATION=+
MHLEDHLSPLQTSMLFFNEFYTSQAICLLQLDFYYDIYSASFCNSLSFDHKKDIVGPQGYVEHDNEFFTNTLK